MLSMLGFAVSSSDEDVDFGPSEVFGELLATN